MNPVDRLRKKRSDRKLGDLFNPFFRRKRNAIRHNEFFDDRILNPFYCGTCKHRVDNRRINISRPMTFQSFCSFHQRTTG